MAKSCECKGIELFRDIISTTLEFVENPESPAVPVIAANLAETTYRHLVEQANEPQNSDLAENVHPLIERMRKGLTDYQDNPILALEVVRDSIHKSPALQQLLVCGGPYKISDPDARTEPAKVIGQVCEIFGNTDDDVMPILNTLYKSSNCEESPLEAMKRKMAQQFM